MTIGETTPEALAALIIFAYTNKLAACYVQAAFPDLPRDNDPTVEDGAERDTLMNIYLLVDRLLFPDPAKKACIALINEIKAISTLAVATFLRGAYKRLPAGDETLRPLLTASVANRCSVPSNLTVILRDVLLQEDRATYLATDFMRLMRNGGSDGEAVERIFDHRWARQIDIPRC